MNSYESGGAAVPVDKSDPLVVDGRGIVKRFGRVVALDGVNISVREGEIHVLAGHNGAGKTTLFRIIVGLLRRDAGALTVLGRDPSSPQWREALRLVGYVPEDAMPYDRLTGYEYLRFFARIYAESDDEVERMVERGAKISGLSERDLARKAGEYSNGMRRRLLIARALMHSPRLVLLDEPTNGLDVFAAHEVRRLIKSMASQGTTFLIATHNMAEAQYLATSVTFMAYGRVLFSGSVKEAIEAFSASDLEEAFVRAVGVERAA